MGAREGGEDVIKNIYIYLVLFATLMMIIGGSIAAFMAIADIAAPAYYYQSFEDYKLRFIDRGAGEVEQDIQLKPTEAELRESYDLMILQERTRQQERAKNNLIKSFGWVAIPLPVFIYFQRRLAKTKTEEA